MTTTTLNVARRRTLVRVATDLDKAVTGAMASKYRNAGQTCVCANRIYVQDGVYDTFARKLTDKVKGFKVGPGTEPGVVIGPLIDENGVKKAEAHVQDAVSKGAKIVLGGKRHSRGGLFFEPTVIADVTPAMVVSREETFGPVVPVIEVSSAAEALELTNASPFGLTAAVFTGDLERGLAFAEQARAGWVNINASTNLWESHLPFGGRSGSVSGRGRVGGRFAMEAFTEPKTILYPAPHLGR